MTALKVTGLLLLIAGVFVWVASILPPLPNLFALPDDSRIVQVASPLPAVEDGRAVLEGIAIYDGTYDSPVPYIQYRLPDGEVRTKQLIFRDERGCSPRSGDIPCLLPDDPYPEVAYGSRIRVTGRIEGDQILVDELSYL